MSETRRLTDDLYREHAGDEALERQRQAALEFWPCCGERRTDAHHPVCRNFVPPDIHEDQERLL